MWGNDPTHSQMDSHFGSWTPNGLSNLQKSIWKVKFIGLKSSLYHWKFLEISMFKVILHDPFECLKNKVWLKKRLRVNGQFDSRPLKVKNRLKLRVCMWHGTYHWKAFNKGYNFAKNFASIRGLHKKLWASKVVGVPISRISGLLTWES